MRRSFKFRLYPTHSQELKLLSTLKLCSELYNACLQERKDAFRFQHKSINYYKQTSQLPDIKNIRPELNSVYSQVLQNVCKRVHLAFNAFFRRCKAGEKPGYPRFHSSKRYSSFTYPQCNRTACRKDRVFLPKIGWIRWSLWKDIADLDGVKTLTVKREADGWYCVLSCVLPLPEPLPKTGNVIGIDLGIQSLMATSEGELIPCSQALKQADKKLKRLHRALSRKKKGSRRRTKAINMLGRAYQKIARQRKHHIDNVVLKLVKENDVIAVEDLNIKGLSGGFLAKSVHNASWGYLVHALSCKAEWAGRIMLKVDPRHTSQECPRCGKIKKKTLGERIHSCECGCEMDRDIAAAIIIRERALRALREGTALVSCSMAPKGAEQREVRESIEENA